MIKITYEYVCDICASQIHDKQEFAINPFENGVTPQPVMRNAVGLYHVCGTCMYEAREVLMHKYHTTIHNRRG